MEIERKYLLDQLPENLTSYPCKKIEQGYLSTEPVVRIRRSDDEYYLTYKSKGLMVREEYNLPLTKESYLHLREKADGTYKVSVRTGTHADASAICAVLGGGGHVRAAGCTLEGTDEQAAAQMLEAIRRTVPGIA